MTTALMRSEFLNARMLDMLLGDWDRHEDQWRWKDRSKGKTRIYVVCRAIVTRCFTLHRESFPKLPPVIIYCQPYETSIRA